MVPSEVVANVAPSKTPAPTADPPAKSASATTANAVVRQWDEMVTDLGDLGEPMHIEGLP